ncbi:hypothetical protein CerSpe_249390 [Prunus speciosa]
MNKQVEEGVEPPLKALLDGKRGKKTKAKRKSKATTSKDHNTELEPVQAAPEPVQIEPEPIQIEPEPVQIEPEPVQIEPEPDRIEPEPVQNDEESSRDGPRVSVSMFDDSVENHFRVMDTIAKLCGEAEEDHRIEDSEIQSLSSPITFLREWADFKYEPRDVRFACGGGSPDGKDVVTGITLRQYSSATVPKKEALSGDTSSPELSQDFVMYVGGPVWALDWCPRVHQRPDYHPKCEFVAIAAHPPGSSYHKLGQPLTGRGAIQIWCLLNVGVNEENSHPIGEKPKREPKKSGAREENPTEPKRPIGRPRKKPLEEKSTEPKRPRGRPRKNPIEESVDKDATEEKSTRPKRPRGRPLKKPIEESVDNLDGSSNFVEALSIQYPEGSPELHSTGCVPANTQEHDKKRKNYKHAASESNPTLKSYARRRKLNDMESAGNNNNYMCPPLLNQNEENGPLVSDYHIQQSSGQDPQTSNNVQDNDYPKIGSTRCSVPEDVALPRIVLCLAHHGKVAWDVKWRPPSEHDSKCKHRMGYLAVLSGNGSLEVWDVPLPHAVEVIYSSSSCREGTDPRFIKLAPVFRCSMLKCGSEKSIPLTVEWSASPAHDYLLAGCHDGTVALWKFSASNASQDTRPLLCFSADTNPIRALAWAPVDSYSEGANVIATAGHGGLKFWDLRDPFRPLWDLDHLPKFIYSLDWLPDPRCVILSFDDGTMKVISLVKAASDDPVTGMAGTKQPGLHNLSCLPFAIWSVHVSRLTGMAAYCGADGTVLRFQLTSKSVEKDPRRHRAPHFLCVSLTMEESAVTINTTVSNTPFPLKVVRNNPESNKVKSANDKMAKDSASEDQTLALCYGVDPDIQSEYGEKVASLKRKKTQKSGSSETMPEDDLALVCVDEEPTSTQEQEIGEKGASVRSRKTQKSRFSKKKPDDLALVSIDEEPTNTQDEDTGVASLKSKKTQKSRSSKKNPNDGLGLVCIGEEEPTNTLEEEIGVASPESKKKQKPRSSKKKPNDDQDLACIDEEPINTQEEEAGKELEIFPNKIVAMHRVRWNMNKGSERWLCYGGAAGLVRCQEIVLSDTEKAWAMKR